MKDFLKDFLDSCLKSKIPEVYELACGIAMTDAFAIKNKIYSIDSEKHKFQNAIFLQVRSKFKEVFGEDEVKRYDNQLKEEKGEFMNDFLSDIFGIDDNLFNP